MKFSSSAPVKIVVIGAGGTGGYAIPQIYKIACVTDRNCRIIICDGDMVEEKNLIRQNFIPNDIGKNKAQVLAERYSAAYGMECEYIPEYIEDEQSLLSLVYPDFARQIGYYPPKFENQRVILIGCVDNNRSRQICHNVFLKMRDLIYIDSGNESENGQVVCGVRQKGRTTYKPVGSVYPDILNDEDKLPTELSCAQRAVSAPQSITANLFAATLIVCYLYNLLMTGEINTRYVTFSSRLMNIEWRVAATNKEKTQGMAVAYVDSRAIQARLDSIFGCENWQNDFVVTQGATDESTTYVCRIGIYSPERNEWIFKSDGSGPTDFEPVKGGLSGALKRAASVWGVGRYLYSLDTKWVEIQQQGKNYIIKSEELDTLRIEYNRAMQERKMADKKKKAGDGTSSPSNTNTSISA